jgi:UDP-N-acetylglucosamine--N-acetylmuramyl-(pentapeptide) pyrophosphoryl-undecaprenol N-acetylglucosamine transferase
MTIMYCDCGSFIGSRMSRMSLEESKLSRLEREVHRLRTSPSLRLGSHITNAIRKPWKAPFLIITLPIMMMMIGFELIGRKAPPATFVPNLEVKNTKKRNCVVMFPTNGVGFGHFTRMLAIAKRMKKADPSLEIIFFTTMPTLHLLKPYGIAAYHISGPKYFDNLATNEWNILLEEQLSLCFDTHKPKQFIFDGAFPYRGMLRAIEHKDFNKIWVRRGMFRKGATNIPVDSIEHFDILVRPGDSKPLDLKSEQSFNIEKVECDPIILVDSSELYPKEHLRNRLGIPLHSTVVYIQLGAGEINEIESDLELSVRLCLEHENTFVVIGESMIGSPLNITGERIRILRDYPNSLYFNSFDFAIMAGGYNSYHEAIAFNLPTICIPNKNTGMDDQVARAKMASDAGAMLVLEDVTEPIFTSAITNMFDPSYREKMTKKSNHLGNKNGAERLAEQLSGRV